MALRDRTWALLSAGLALLLSCAPASRDVGAVIPDVSASAEPSPTPMATREAGSPQPTPTASSATPLPTPAARTGMHDAVGIAGHQAPFPPAFIQALWVVEPDGSVRHRPSGIGATPYMIGVCRGPILRLSPPLHRVTPAPDVSPSAVAGTPDPHDWHMASGDALQREVWELVWVMMEGAGWWEGTRSLSFRAPDDPAREIATASSTVRIVVRPL
ncbi:MAG: hypothetical protein VKO64_01480 [Candidatus Sericytochromatia bacterium]|nr:hypothetical protein [Candidatus Sericytochromatia bacterium]